MFRKSFLAAAMLFAFAAASFAAEIVTMDLNYQCRGNLKLLSKLPDGITMSGRKDYKQKKFAGHCLYTVRIDVSKVQEFELVLEVVDTGKKESAELSPSLWVPKGLNVECTEFETGDEPAAQVPCRVAGWKRMQTITVSKGEKITVKGKFKKNSPAPAAAAAPAKAPAPSADPAASSAPAIVTMDLNYKCRGNLKLLSKLPDGVTMTGRKNYKQKKFAGDCLYTVKIDLNKVQEFELVLEVVDTGSKESADFSPSLWVPKGLDVECTEFETGDEPASQVPCRVAGWKRMQTITVSKGEKITVKCKFRKIAAAK